MTKYLANQNGDWWTVTDTDDSHLFFIDTEDPKLQDALKDWGYVDGEWNDKLERFIWEHGKVVHVDEV
jgi:hypothetical protein